MSDFIKVCILVLSIAVVVWIALGLLAAYCLKCC